MTLRTLLLAVLIGLGGCASDGLPPGTSAKEAAKLNLQLGAEYASKGDYDLAVDKLQRAIKQDPDLAPAHSTLAYAYSALGRNELAEEQYRKALSLGGDDGNVRNNFGVFLCAHGKPEEAQRYFVEAANYRDYATPAAAWTNAGVCARRQPDLAAAERYFRQALQVNPNFPDALAQMVWLSYQKKDYLRCRAFLQRYEAVGQPTAETLWIGALNERELGDRGAAQDYASRLQQKFPDSEQALNLQSSSP